MTAASRGTARMRAPSMAAVVALGSLLAVGVSGCSGAEAVPEQSFTNSVGMQMVRLTPGYYVSKYETRQSEFEAVVGYNPSKGRGPNKPVENLTGDEALSFCKELTEHERAAGRLPAGYHYALPKFKQWLEYADDAPLAGSVTPVGGKGGSHLDFALDVGSGERNRLGLYDIRGNVAEYSSDLYNTGSQVIVGAHWIECRDDFLRVRNKAGFMSADVKGKTVGFRCVLVKDE